MDTNSMRNGDLYAWVATLDADRREDFAVISPDAREDDETLVWLLVGRVGILVSPDGTAQLRVHDHPETEDVECWERIAGEMRDAIAEHNGRAIIMRRNPEVQQLIQAGMPPAMAAQVSAMANPFATPDMGERR